MTDQHWRDVTRRLFARDDEQPEEQERPADSGNYSPREGNNPRSAEDPMRTFVRDLFSDND